MTGRTSDANFSQALRYMSEGCHVRRPHWAPDFIVKRTNQVHVDSTGANWLPTAEDLVATDWLVVDEQPPAEELA